VNDRWSWEDLGTRQDVLDVLVYQSRLLGAEQALVLRGGGNTSIKRDEVDFRGRTTPVLRIKGSGSDLATCRASDFPGVRMSDVLPLFGRESMSDEDMVAYIAHCLMEPVSPRPSIETLLHAFIPAAAVAHTHADAILSLTNTDDFDGLLREVYGNTVLRVPYRRPGFELSKEVGAAVRQHPSAAGLVLINHGLVTWGADSESAYRRHIGLVTVAERYLVDRTGSRSLFVVETPRYAMDATSRRSVIARLSPVIRGILSHERRAVLTHDDAAEVLDFVGSSRARTASAAGAATPDHILCTGVHPLWVDIEDPKDADGVERSIRQAIDAYRQNYRSRVDRWRGDEKCLSPDPRVVLAPGLGMWAAGRDIGTATVVRDTYRHTMAIIAGAESVASYRSLDEREAFRAEYWPLELYKATLAPQEREFARRVAMITGGANGIGRAIALALGTAGAHVVVTDVDFDAAQSVCDEIRRVTGSGHSIALPLDVTNEEEVEAAFAAVCCRFGGLDVLVSNAGVARSSPLDQLELADWNRSLEVNATGHFLVSRAALRLFRRQGIGGNIVFVGTKNIVAPGRDFGAYSSAKAAEAQLARVVAIEGAPDGIRANVINPDAIFGDSRLWSPALREERARSYGIRPEDLEEYYRHRALLRVRVTAEDVAHAALFLASDRSSKTTGAMVPVDGGVREAFPR